MVDSSLFSELTSTTPLA